MLRLVGDEVCKASWDEELEIHGCYLMATQPEDEVCKVSSLELGQEKVRGCYLMATRPEDEVCKASSLELGQEKVHGWCWMATQLVGEDEACMAS